MKKALKGPSHSIVFTGDNVDNMKKVIGSYKNILVCGVKGVGKITNTVQALQDNTNVYYSGNPVDFEGKSRPGSYEKYLKYILNLKKDITRVNHLSSLFTEKNRIILIIDEIYGRSEEQLAEISRLYDMENIQILQIVGCMKSMGPLIEKIDVIVELHNDGAFIVDNELGRVICAIFGKKANTQSQKTGHA
ncbi:MAG: hypothetical protein OEW04_08760 [Nitrospirota bacterium]|nr:hypothetical protein [Nitrospirota bacterium]